MSQFGETFHEYCDEAEAHFMNSEMIIPYWNQQGNIEAPSIASVAEIHTTPTAMPNEVLLDILEELESSGFAVDPKEEVIGDIILSKEGGITPRNIVKYAIMQELLKRIHIQEKEIEIQQLCEVLLSTK